MAKRIKDQKQNWHYHLLQADPGQSCTVTSKLLGTGMPDIRDKHGMTTYRFLQRYQRHSGGVVVVMIMLVVVVMKMAIILLVVVMTTMTKKINQ
jgi:hypothetical protein